MAGIIDTLATIFFKQEPHKIGAISVDCVINDTFTYESQITDYPVEDGYYIQDNVWRKPFVYTMRGIISDAHIGNSFDLTELSSSSSPTQDAMDKLISLMDQKILFDIVTSLKIYNNMIFTKFEPTRDSNTGNSLNFNAEFKQLILVSSKSVVINSDKTDDKSYPDTVSNGTQQTKKLDTTEIRDDSILYKERNIFLKN
jgi:hypothetical protein